MSDGIFYEGKIVGSVHYFTYKENTLPGNRNDLYLRFHDAPTLQEFLSLPGETHLVVGEEETTLDMFRRQILRHARDIHFEYVHDHERVPTVPDAPIDYRNKHLLESRV